MCDKRTILRKLVHSAYIYGYLIDNPTEIVDYAREIELAEQGKLYNAQSVYHRGYKEFVVTDNVETT